MIILDQRLDDNGVLIDVDRLDVLYKVVTGSTSYGLSLEGSSDVDIKGIFMHDKMDVLGMREFDRDFSLQDTYVFHDPEDLEFHTVSKILKLAGMKQNPTVLEMLYTREEFVLHRDSRLDPLFEIRDVFLTKNAYHSFGGYAREQLVRIKNAMDKMGAEDLEDHVHYVLSSLIRGLNERYDMGSLGSVQINDINLKNNGKYIVDMDIDLSGNFDQSYSIMSELNNTLKSYNKQKNRNRKATPEKLYKHAAHLIRLLKMGIEVLNGEGLIVYRENDREFLMDVRLGKVSWEHVFAYVDELFIELDEASKLNVLPENYDEKKLIEAHKKIITNVYGC